MAMVGTSVDAESLFLAAMAQRYVWDKTETEALAFPERTILRVMDLGTIGDVLDMERELGRDRLLAVLRRAPAASMRPRSWWFWHYRLGLADAEHDPPVMPVRTFA